jgi:hypothetical protein
LDEVAAVLQSGLEDDFCDVSVTVVDCPDLSQKPFLLASKGICGSPCVMDIGGVPYLIPTPHMDKIYDLRQVPTWSEQSSTSTLIIGAGAAPTDVVGKLAELMPNLRIDPCGTICNQTRFCKVDDKTGNYVLESLDSCCDCNHLMNIYVSEGQQGKVLKVTAKHRKNETGNFKTAMQMALRNRYGTQPVGLGGVFVLTKGKARIHVMPCYSEVPLTSNDMIDDWLKFYTMAAPLTSVGYLMSHDPGLDLRMEHFHCFSEHGDGGHFHYDVTPDEAEYIGYFNVPEYIFRIDQCTTDLPAVKTH